MYPGFVDGHGHFPRQGAYDLYQVNLSSPLLGGTVDTMDKLVAKLAQKARTVPEGMPIIGWRYDDTQIAEQRHPTRHDLDKASTRHPIMIMHISGHIAAVNSATIEKYKVPDSNDTPGLEKDADGKITGVLFELKARSLMPLLDELKTNAGFGTARATQVYAAAGVTTADLGGAIILQQLPQLQSALSREQLGLRVLVHPYGYRIAKGSKGDAHGPAQPQGAGLEGHGRRQVYGRLAGARHRGRHHPLADTGRQARSRQPAQGLSAARRAQVRLRRLTAGLYGVDEGSRLL